MNWESLKIKVKPLEIVIVIVAIVVISFSAIAIKNHMKNKELNKESLAETNVIQEGDVVIDFASAIEANLEEPEKEKQTNKKEKIVIKNGSTGVIEIPSINVLAQITEGSDNETLKNYVGVVEGSSRPGQVGNYSIAAHNNIHTEIFRNLHKVEEGALVNIYTPSKMYTYKVTSKTTVSPTQTEVLDKSSDKKEITLITCNSNATARIIVKGILTSETRVSNI